MKDKEIIKEMAKEIFNICAWRFGNPNDYKEVFNDIAEDLTKLNYRKIDKDSIVISRELLEINDVKSVDELVIISRPNLMAKLELKEKEARKEMAEKFAKDIFNHITTPEVWKELRTLWLYIDGNKNANRPIWNLLIEPIAKQLGIEIKE